MAATTTISARVNVRSGVSTGGVFVAAMAVVTAVPWLAAPLLGSNGGLMVPVLFAATLHVPSTLVLYGDRGARAVMRSHPARFYWVPIVLLVGGPLAFSFISTRLAAAALTGVLAWQSHHFAKQNLGVVSFAYRVRGSGRMHPAERRAILAGGVTGILATVLAAAPYERVLPVEVSRVLPVVAGVSLAVTIAALAAALRSARRDAVSTAFLVGSSLFFLPAIAFGAAGVTAVAVAHAFQYLLISTFIARGASDAGEPKVVHALAACAVAAVVIWVLHDIPGSGAAFGLVLATSAAHFIIDAGIWRLSQPEQRAYVTSRLPFIG